MKKIPTLFIRQFHEINENGTPKHGSRFTLTDQVTPGCEWVLDGEGFATRKWDGTCVLIRSGKVFKRYDAKHGKTPPPGFEPAQPEADPITGHWPGWLPLKDYPDNWIWEAYVLTTDPELYEDGTYEAVGPKINGNKDGEPGHILMKHGEDIIFISEISFESIRQTLSELQYEGIVFHHPDGRMCKIKRSDFGLKW